MALVGGWVYVSTGAIGVCAYAKYSVTTGTACRSVYIYKRCVSDPVVVV